MRARLSAFLVLVLVLLTAAAPPAAAETATTEAAATIRQFNARLLQVMKDGPRLGFKGRADTLRPAVVEAYDMAGMTRNTLGAAAARLTPDEAARLVEAYAAFSVATYASQFTEWDGETFEVGETRPSVAGQVIVASSIVPRTGAAVAIDYVMRQVDGRWRIADVMYQGTVSQVAVRRSEFTSIFRAAGLAGLIERIEALTAGLAPK